MKMTMIILLCAGCFLAGWSMAHHTVAAECERLGGFFVGKKTYYCHKIEPKEGKE